MKSGPSEPLLQRMEQTIVVRTIRNGAVMIIPVLIIGAFALVLQSLPLHAYQRFLAETAVGGFIKSLLEMANRATFGTLSLYMTYSISRSYMKQKADADAVMAGAVVSSLLSFFVVAGVNLPNFGLDNMGPKSMFLAVITGLGASALYRWLARTLHKWSRIIFSQGADWEFNRMLTTLFPVALVALVAVLFNQITVCLFGVDSFRSLLAAGFNGLFRAVPNGFFKGLLFVMLSSVLWFFGIHGSDTLEGVMQTYFVPGLAENQAAAAAGQALPNVLTKEFFDCFVLMGGCGTTICLLVALLVASRNKARRGLGWAASIPMLFNINELMVFGLPIIFNPVMLVPFLTVPLVCYSISYAALSLGLVPMIANTVEWTTPIFLGGFHATGSIAGALLQLFNLTLGVIIYLPFVRMLDRNTANGAKRNYDAFMAFFKQNETELAGEKLTGLSNVYGDFAKSLCADLRYGLQKQVVLFYQPQHHYNGECRGVEALLRWHHPVHGMLYPPLVVKLAEEGGFLPLLEETVLAKALQDRPRVLKQFGPNVKISVNVTGTTVITPRFLQFCREQNEKTPVAGCNICLEVTEQAALAFSDDARAALRELRDLGFSLAIDDFSMGQTSLHYLKDNLFDVIKLDGSLIKGLADSRTYHEIVSSITRLAHSLHLDVLAEYVESEEQREILHSMGCDLYQGYLYGAAQPLKEE